MNGPRVVYRVNPVWEDGEGNHVVCEDTYAGRILITTKKIATYTSRDAAISLAKNLLREKSMEEERKATFFREYPSTIVGEIK